MGKRDCKGLLPDLASDRSFVAVCDDADKLLFNRTRALNPIPHNQSKDRSNHAEWVNPKMQRIAMVFADDQGLDECAGNGASAGDAVHRREADGDVGTKVPEVERFGEA